MAASDLIAASFKVDWVADHAPLCPGDGLFYGRAKQPAQLAGFPYMVLNVTQLDSEVMTIVNQNTLVGYELKIEVYTVQDMTGGTSSGNQLTDQGNLQRALESVLNHITPNVGWNYVQDFLHCLRGPSELDTEADIFEGRDLYKSTNFWNILTCE